MADFNSEDRERCRPSDVDLIINRGEIRAHGGRVLLTASQSQDVFSRAVNTTGLAPGTSVGVNTADFSLAA